MQSMKATAALYDRDLLDLMPTAVYVIDELGRIRSFNEKACTLWGRVPKLMDTDERFCGAFRLSYADGRPLAHAETPMATAVTTGVGCRNTEVVIHRTDGTDVTVMVNISCLRDDDGRIVGAINAFQDVTDLVHARRQLEARERDLGQAVAARDGFLSMCSHELKTPITTLKL